MWADCECPCGCGRLGWKFTGPRVGQKGEEKDTLSPCAWKSWGDVLLAPGSLAQIQQMAFPFPLLPPLCGCWVKHGSPDLISGFAMAHILSLRSFNERALTSPCGTANAPGTEPGGRRLGWEGWLRCQPSPLESHQETSEWEEDADT